MEGSISRIKTNEPRDAAASVFLRAVLYAGAFVTGGIVMSFEMLGSRYLNPYFGGGIYTWASLISTVLAALTVGYFAGGIVADRRPRPALLGGAVLIGSAFIVALPAFSTAMLEGLLDAIDDIKRVIREVDCPHMATLSQAAGAKRRSLEELEAAGVVAATFPSLALFAAAHAVRNVLRILKRENSLTAAFDHLLPLEDYYTLVGLKEQLAREEAYDQAAAALARKRAAE